MNSPRLHKLASKVVGVVVSLLLAEALGWLALAFDGGHWEGWHRAAELRRQVLDSGGALGTEARSREVDRFLARSSEAFSENVLHPFLGFVAKPVELEKWAGKTHPEAANLGFPTNTEALIQNPSPDRLLVGVFGGSVAQIFGVAGSQALADGLSKVPRFAGREVVVLDLALGGMKQPQQLMTLNYLLVLGGH
ncbi:MAG: hypothetical protein KDD47_14230, partial [Acidobacteria bacterium]|nr:hypothetical protein [Acidobacteriota bacterium]